MYEISRNGRVMLDGKAVDLNTLPKSKTFSTPRGSCVVVARSKKEHVELLNAEKIEDLEGYKEALEAARA